MTAIKTFKDLEDLLKNTDKPRKKVAVANAVDSHSLEAAIEAVNRGVIEAYLVGDVASIENQAFFQANPSPYIHVVDQPDPQTATETAVRMVREGECDFLMKGLVNTDVLLRAVLNKEKGLMEPGAVLSFNATVHIPGYHKLVQVTDPAVVPKPTKEQRVQIIKYSLEIARKMGVARPKVALIHATEKFSPKIPFMQDYMDILEMWRNGEFGDCIMDGPMDTFIALDKERGSIKTETSPVLGDSDILIFPDFASANAFYKGLVTFAGAGMAGLLQGPRVPVVVTSRSDSSESKFHSICLAALMAD